MTHSSSAVNPVLPKHPVSSWRWFLAVSIATWLFFQSAFSRSYQNQRFDDDFSVTPVTHFYNTGLTLWCCCCDALEMWAMCSFKYFTSSRWPYLEAKWTGVMSSCIWYYSIHPSISLTMNYAIKISLLALHCSQRWHPLRVPEDTSLCQLDQQ